jgi:hypothetical protein
MCLYIIFHIFRFSNFQISIFSIFSDFNIFRFSDFQIFRFSDFQIFRFQYFQISYIFKSSFVFYDLIMGLIVFLREEIQREKTKKIIDMFQSIIFLLFFVVVFMGTMSSHQ